uniref:IgGFc_binding domain-containing protein n=1 Tax=Rhabditophanes sp. KR3021 TaxID=114890 RepID=A0AC35TW40_9BILA
MVNDITITYFLPVQNKLWTDYFTLDPNGQTSYRLEYADVVRDNFNIDLQHVQIPDPRIFITSKYSVKVISRIFNIATGKGDSEMVPSSTFAGRNYVVQLPKANPGAAQIIHILNTGVNDTIIKVTHYIDFQYYTSFGITSVKERKQLQTAIVAPSDTRQHSFLIEADSDIFVVGAVTCVDLLSTNAIASTKDSSCDYAMMHFYPSADYDCTRAFIGLGDQRVITSQFTKSLYVSPPHFTNCQSLKVPIYVYDQRSPIISLTVQLQKGIAQPLTLTAAGQEATSSHYTNAPWTRFGGTRGIIPANKEQLFSAFVHYVPEASQFINGDIRFITYSSNSILEVYGDQTVAQFAAFYMDGVAVNPNAILKREQVIFFNSKYTAFTIQVPASGFHAFSVKSKGSYMAYVNGNNVNGLTGSYGYVAGYNRINIDSYYEPMGTVAPLLTTTKGAGRLGGSLLIVLFGFVYLM